MRIQRDAAGRVHIDDDGVSAIVDSQGGRSSLSMTTTASAGAIQRVCDVVEDSTQWPTMRLPVMAFALGDLEGK